jgi:hypothetical protein
LLYPEEYFFVIADIGTNFYRHGARHMLHCGAKFG